MVKRIPDARCPLGSWNGLLDHAGRPARSRQRACRLQRPLGHRAVGHQDRTSQRIATAWAAFPRRAHAALPRRGLAQRRRRCQRALYPSRRLANRRASLSPAAQLRQPRRQCDQLPPDSRSAPHALDRDWREARTSTAGDRRSATPLWQRLAHRRRRGRGRCAQPIHRRGDRDAHRGRHDPRHWPVRRCRCDPRQAAADRRSARRPLDHNQRALPQRHDRHPFRRSRELVGHRSRRSLA